MAGGGSSSGGGGFNFDLAARNEILERRGGVKGAGFTKTGTTIAGVIFKVRGWRGGWGSGWR